MKTHIPASVAIRCDRCDADCTTSQLQGGLILNRNAVDFQGCAVADGTSRWDLCDRCTMRLEGIIREEIRRP